MAVQIKCPNCGLEFGDDDVFNNKIEQALMQQKKELMQSQKEAIEQAVNTVKANAQVDIQKVKLDNQHTIQSLQQQVETQTQTYKNNLQAMSDEQKAIVKTIETQKKLDIIQAVQNIEKERDQLHIKLSNIAQEQKVAMQNIELQNQIKIGQVERDAQREKEELQNELKIKDSQQMISEQKIKEQYEFVIKRAEEELQREKEHKAKLNVKLTGENLEQHCQNEFDLYRAAFPRAKFYKDNEIVDGTKGDFVFKNFDEFGNEILSILFEMKNENENTTVKQKNEQFLDKLDKDRNKKKCDYAVLVTMLEQGSVVYDRGMVDKSLEYSKMYIIRPQFFIPLITMLTSTANILIKDKQELVAIKNQNYELVEFEKRIEAFKEGFSKNYELADTQFTKAIGDIDKSIDALQRTKENLVKSARQLGLASKKTDDITIRKLTKGLPSVQNLLEESKKQD